MPIPELKRRFASESPVFARLRSLERAFPERVSLVPTGAALFQKSPKKSESRYGEGMYCTDTATPDSVTRSIATAPLVLLTIQGEKGLSALDCGDLPIMEFAREKDFDGIHIVPMLEEPDRQSEVVLLSERANSLAREKYTPVFSRRSRRTGLQAALTRLRDSWSDVMPIAKMEYGPYKVRLNFWQEVVLALDMALYDQKVPKAKEQRVQGFLDTYAQPDRYASFTTLAAIREANALLGELIEEQ